MSVSEDIVKVWSLNDESCVNQLNCSGRKLTSCAFHPTYPSFACHWLLPGKSLYLVWPLPVIHHSSKTRLHGPRLPFLDGALNFIDWPSTFQFLQIFQPLPLQFSRAYLLIQVILFEVSQISISSSIIGNVMNIISYHEVSLIYKLGIACSTIP